MTAAAPRRLVLSAGEPSGDILAADLAQRLKRLDPALELAGITGPAMREAGVESWFDIDQLSVMGLAEIVSALPRLIRLRRHFRQRILDWSPTAFMGVDAPEFNLGLARQLKNRGLTTLHYVSPSVWAWRPGRVAGIAHSIDHLLALFPFEPECYASTDLAVSWVGHPLADQLGACPAEAQLDAVKSRARAQLGLNPSAPVLALLPGRRRSELQRHLPLLEQVVTRLRQSGHSDLQCMVLLAKADDSAGALGQYTGVSVHHGQTRLGLQAADVALCASGTVTLEAFLLGCPQAVFYRLAASTHCLASTFKLVRTQHVALPNILCQHSLVPERLQDAANAESLVADVLAWLSDVPRQQAYRQHARQWAERLQSGDRAAMAVLSSLPA